MLKKILCLVMLLTCMVSCSNHTVGVEQKTVAEEHYDYFEKAYEQYLDLIEYGYTYDGRCKFYSPESSLIWKEDPLIYDIIDMEQDKFIRSEIFAVKYYDIPDHPICFYNIHFVVENGEITRQMYEYLGED